VFAKILCKSSQKQKFCAKTFPKMKNFAKTFTKTKLFHKNENFSQKLAKFRLFFAFQENEKP
jgi:hypothetical protein